MDEGPNTTTKRISSLIMPQAMDPFLINYSRIRLNPYHLVSIRSEMKISCGLLALAAAGKGGKGGKHGGVDLGGDGLRYVWQTPNCIKDQSSKKI